MKFEFADTLFATHPALRTLVQTEPDKENIWDFIARLHRSGTPEDAVTVVAFAFKPKVAMFWCHHCLVRLSENPTSDDTGNLKLTQDWLRDPGETTPIRPVNGWHAGSAPPSELLLLSAALLAFDREAKAECAGLVGRAMLNLLACGPSGNRAATLNEMLRTAVSISKLD